MPTAEDPDPLGTWWDLDGVNVWRCKICLRRQDEIHGMQCPLGQVKALVAALVESEEAMGEADLARVILLAALVGVPVAGPEFD
jgi:hypothetical protein